MKIYAGVGSRTTPPHILDRMTGLGAALAKQGYLLRSGGAAGADTAFEAVSTQSEIFTPWASFGTTWGRAPKPTDIPFWRLPDEVQRMALLVASVVHPNWRACNDWARMAHARNVCQIYGKDLNTPVDFVIAYSEVKHGEPQGGTRTAIKIAEAGKIPVYNLFFEDDWNAVCEHILESSEVRS